MKKIITLLLATLLALGAVFGLAACKKEEPARTYTIKYELNGGINSPDNPETYTSQTETIIFSAPTKEGYLFMGWRNEEGKLVTEIKKGSVGNIVLTAEWEKDVPKITFRFDLENTLCRETYKAQVSYYPFRKGSDGYKQLTVNGKTVVSDINVNVGEAPGDKLPTIDAFSGGDWSTYGWVYKTGDTYKILKSDDIITEENFGAENGVVILYGCVKSNWVGPY